MSKHTLPALDPEAVAFFAEHAGLSYNPERETPEEGQQRNARIHARAESWLKGQDDLRIDWADDDEIRDHVAEYDGYDSEPETCEYAALTNSNVDVLASLGCIDDATPEYRRVVEAELALEAMPTELVCGCEIPDTCECGTCGSTWCARCHPSPSYRCHWEAEHEETEDEGDDLDDVIDNVREHRGDYLADVEALVEEVRAWRRLGR